MERIGHTMQQIGDRLVCEVNRYEQSSEALDALEALEVLSLTR